MDLVKQDDFPIRVASFTLLIVSIDILICMKYLFVFISTSGCTGPYCMQDLLVASYEI